MPMEIISHDGNKRADLDVSEIISGYNLPEGTAIHSYDQATGKLRIIKDNKESFIPLNEDVMKRFGGASLSGKGEINSAETASDTI